MSQSFKDQFNNSQSNTNNSFDFLPNLPGFKCHEVKGEPFGNGRKQIFKKDKGVLFMNKAGSVELELEPDQLAASSIVSIGSTSPSKKSFSSDLVLIFLGRFKDIQGQDRNVTMYFYPDDATIKIIEQPRVNSGMPQGVLLRRFPVKKSDGSSFSIYDFVIGEEININMTNYWLVDCASKTRQYLSDAGMNVPESYQEGDNQMTKSHKARKNELKVFMEAKLGNTVNNAGRFGFMNYGSQNLKFLVSWDDTDNLYGERAEFGLTYYLADDTVEMFNINAKDQFPKLLKRAPLPKQFDVQVCGSGRVTDNSLQTYHWSDFYISKELNVYSRQVIILDADARTRQFYKDHDMELSESQRISTEVDAILTREIPPHLGFGSEEDSLKSCIGPLVPRASTIRLGENVDSTILSFSAILAYDPDVEAGRKFIFSYYCADGTMKIQEPPVRNSGFGGGQYLSRRKIKKENGQYLTFKDIAIGEEIKIFSQIFLITGADNGTKAYLKSH